MKKILSIIFKDTTICILLFIIASIPRIVLLEQIPPGLHGDEGMAGIDARRILKEGLLPSPYVGRALGQPMGPIYSTALFFRLFQDNIFWLRLSMAIFGIITVPLLYVFLRLFFGKSAALLTSIAFCFSLYHIHFSRVAFIVISAPFFQLIAFIFLITGIKKKRLYLIILSGIFTGLGLYSYALFILFPIAIVLSLLYNVFKHRLKRKEIQTLFLFILSVFIVSLPLLRIVIYQYSFYFSHYHIYSIFNLPQVKMQEILLEKAKTILAFGFANLFNFFNGQKIDFVDAFGKYHNFHYLYILFCLLSIVIVFIKKQKWALYFFIALLFFLIPNFITYDAIYRRPILSLVPFYFFLAYGIHTFLAIKQKTWRFVVLVSFTFVIAFVSIQNLTIYFQKFSNDNESKWVYAYQLTQISSFIHSLPKPLYIYFYSNRWSYHYETLRFLVQDVPGEDRSTQFGFYSLKNTHLHNSVVYLFLPEYIESLYSIQQLYPNGKAIAKKDKDGSILFFAYIIPKQM